MSNGGEPKLAARGLSIGRRLTLIVLAVAIPMLLLSAAIVWWLAEAQSAMQRDALMYSARTIASSVDAQLGKYITLADALATSPSLQTGDIAAFRGQAERALPRLPGAWVVLADTRGQQLVNTFMPASEPLPVISPNIRTDEARAFETNQVQFSDVTFGQITKRHIASVGLPVFRAKEPAYYLIVAVDVTVFRDLLNSQRLPAGWLAAVIDRNGNFIARSHDHERLVGKPASEGWRAFRLKDLVFENINLDGQPVINASVVSQPSGWAVGVAVVKRMSEAPIRQTVLTASLLGLLVTLMCVLIATWVARSITRPIKALETGAQALRRHEAVSLATTGVPEVDHALDAFGVVSQSLIEHENERSRNIELMRDSEARLRATVDTAVDAIIVIDEDGVVQSVNPAVESIFGYQVEEVVGKNVTLLMPEPYRGVHGDHVGAYRRTGIAKVIGIGREVEGQRKDGKIFPIDLAVAEWRMGGRRFFTGIMRDISVRKQVEEERRTLQAKLLHATRLSEIGRMTAAFAHELNQPLTAVASYIGGCRRILGAGVNDEERKQKLLEVMEQANAQALRAGQVIRQLREFVGTGQRDRTIEDAANVMREACTFAIAAAKHNGTLVRSDISPAGHILVDKIQFQQVVINLVRNALEAMENSPRKELDLGLALRGGKSEVSVSDTGPGIDPEIAGRLFKPFSTTKSEGMGIGLSVCREIVEAHDGKIWAEPNPGGGTVFRFALPLVRDEEMFATTASHLAAGE